jgi:hypothetical protein
VSDIRYLRKRIRGIYTKVHDKIEIKYKKEDEGIDGKTGNTINRILHYYSRNFGIDSN